MKNAISFEGAAISKQGKTRRDVQHEGYNDRQARSANSRWSTVSEEEDIRNHFTSLGH